MNRMFFICLAATLGVGLVQAQDIKRRFCMGERSEECPLQPHYGCPQDTRVGADDIAKGICTINTANGKKVLEFMVTPISSKDGHRCGYTVYEVTCLR